MVHYDADADVLYLGMVPGVEEEFMEIGPHINAELNADGQIIGIEVLRASQALRPIHRALSNRMSRRSQLRVSREALVA